MLGKSLSVMTFVALVLFGISSCTCNRTKWNVDEFDIPDSIRNATQLKISDDAMQEIVGNISSSLETASLIKALGVPFSQKYLASTKNTSRFNTSYSKAFNLGILGADLGYLNMYGRTALVVDYITAIKSLADGINVGQFFDFTTLKRLATNNQNIDSLIYITQQSFNKMDKYLQKNNRGNLSALMVAGVWVEGLYLSTQFYKDKPNVRLAESIGEQKIIFDQLLIILKNYQNEKYIADLISELNPIKELYNNIKITIERGEPQAVEVDGVLKIVQTETSTVHYTDEQMDQFVSTAETVRNKLVQ
jgi:hypothetical protein